MEAHRCMDVTCKRRHEPSERVGLAREICAERGVRLTRLRRRILEMLWESRQPMGAYDLMEELNREVGRPIGPPTVYRVLDFLIDQGLASKIESRNAYVPCAHPERHHNCVFFMCRDCGSSAEIENSELERLLDNDARRVGYRIVRLVVEVEGTCGQCTDSHPG